MIIIDKCLSFKHPKPKILEHMLADPSDKSNLIITILNCRIRLDTSIGFYMFVGYILKKNT